MTPTRRLFLSSLALAPLAPRELLAWEASAAGAAPEAAESGVVQALAAAVEARYASQLEPGDLEEIRKGLEDGLDSARRLRGMALGNADEPVTLFSPRVGEDGASGR